MEGKGRAIGIDLGTTYSCVGVWLTRHQRIEITTNDQGYSCVAFTKTELLIGEAAKKQAGKNPANTIFGMSSVSETFYYVITSISFKKRWRMILC
ncbi:hypothetical protein MRB53_011073 [Persea americana]|uniref:Uncharacterized protein n=1 Tax=Persea americana TaxID=3435 RepID=A0ACC2LTH8_PERAE|nr:hypothetical protein MRB53_011073 [Persea americana]